MSIFSRIKEFFTPKIIYVSQSSLSNPKINDSILWLTGPHYDILELLNKYEGYEFSRKQINYYLGKKSHHTYENILWKAGYLNRRSVGEKDKKRHFYSITPKGKEVVVQFNNRF